VTEACTRTAVVVLNWNGWRDTIPCVESLRAMEDVPSVFVVDNGSSDDSVARIHAAAPWAELVLLESNRGFGAGMNAGIAAALEQDPPFEYVWVLNNDTLVLRETLARMMGIADRDPTIGIVGSRLIHADGSGRVQALGGGGIGRWLGTTSTFVQPTTRSCDHLIGASLLLRRALLLELGGFDERYFFFLEDTDLSVRVRRAGWRLAVATDATVLHRGGASINDGARVPSLASDVQYAKSLAIFLSGLPLPMCLIAIPVRFAAELAKRVKRRQLERLLPIARAYVNGLRIGRRPPMIPMFGCQDPRSP
jgi:GT2 family glycosyltransferase